MRNDAYWAIFILLVLFISGCTGLKVGTQRWSGTIFVDSDIDIIGDLTIEPGTKIIVASHADASGRGEETPADGFNDLDPTRLKLYGKKHSHISVSGKLTAIGTNQNPIIFTSSTKEGYADWEGLFVDGDDSIISHVILSHARNGIAITGKNVVLANSTITDVLWGCISAGKSKARIYGNYVENCGHEGIDNQDGGSQVIENNVINNSHTSIIILDPNSEMIVRGNRMANDIECPPNGCIGRPNLISENNLIDASLDCTNDFEYENYVIPCKDNDGQPYLKN